MKPILNLPASLKEDLDRFREEVERFKKGETPDAQFRSFRVPQGVYEQREDGAFMLRVRLPAGAVLPQQMRVLAAVSREHGNGVLHVTTRQDIQVHGVPLEHIHPALVQLYAVALSTKGGGGNTVRNITACCDAGVCVREAFDVSPYVVALTEFLLPDPLSFRLPRKYKIALSGCPRDCAGATVNDLGLIAKKRGDEPGFSVHVGGGMGSRSRVADLLDEFVPAGEVHLVAEAIKRVFDTHGNRRNKHKARLRFLLKRLGLERFRELYDAELSELRHSGLPPLSVRELPGRTDSAHGAAGPAAEGFSEWRRTNVVRQKQPGLHLAHLPLALGDVDADAFEALAGVVEAYGDGAARTTQLQNMVIRGVPEDALAGLHRELSALGLADALPPILRNVVACTGASTCRLGICLSRGLAGALLGRLTDDVLKLDSLGDLEVHISGCPNCCGRHPIAQIGVHGAARRFGGRLVPHYVVQLGGRAAEGQTVLARGQKAIPARNVPAFIVELLQAFQESPECPDFDAFLDGGGWDVAAKLLAHHGHVPSFQEDTNYYFDWGAEGEFSVAGRGPGECSAGVFDLIEVDLASAREAAEDGRLHAATVLAARALLITQGHEARSDAEALELFARLFVHEGLVEESFGGLIEHARHFAPTTEEPSAFGAEAQEVSALVEAVQSLYDNMDPSLRFRPVGQADAPGPATDPGQTDVDREADLRGAACTLSYVRAKMMLDQMAGGQVLSILLDAEGARNVPASAEKDGHEVLSVNKEGEQWRIVIRRS